MDDFGDMKSDFGQEIPPPPLGMEPITVKIEQHALTSQSQRIPEMPEPKTRTSKGRVSKHDRMDSMLNKLNIRNDFAYQSNPCAICARRRRTDCKEVVCNLASKLGMTIADYVYRERERHLYKKSYEKRDE